MMQAALTLAVVISKANVESTVQALKMKRFIKLPLPFEIQNPSFSLYAIYCKKEAAIFYFLGKNNAFTGKNIQSSHSFLVKNNFHPKKVLIIGTL